MIADRLSVSETHHPPLEGVDGFRYQMWRPAAIPLATLPAE
jgi:hypothetical protein